METYRIKELKPGTFSVQAKFLWRWFDVYGYYHDCRIFLRFKDRDSAKSWADLHNIDAPIV